MRLMVARNPYMRMMFSPMGLNRNLQFYPWACQREFTVWFFKFYRKFAYNTKIKIDVTNRNKKIQISIKKVLFKVYFRRRKKIKFN